MGRGIRAMWRVYVAHVCGRLCALERVIIRQIYLSSATLQIRFDFYLTLGHNMGVRVDKRNRLCTS